MSILQIHDELQQNLASALDVSKMLSVFGTMINIVKDQQHSIHALEAKMASLDGHVSNFAGKMLDDNDSKIAEIEDKVHHIMDHIFGDGSNQKAIPSIEIDKISPFQLFQRSSSVVIAMGNPSLSETVQVAEKKEIEMIPEVEAISEEDFLIEPSKNDEEVAQEIETINIQDPEPITVPVSVTAPLSRPKTPTVTMAAVVESVRVSPVPLVESAMDKSESRPPSSVKSRPQSSLLIRSRPSSRGAFVIGPIMPNVAVYVPPESRSLQRGKSPLVRSARIARRKMDIDNISHFLPEERREAILKELQKRGKFFILAREMLAGNSTAINTQSLRNTYLYI
jgi:hypothetical protein